MEAVLKAISSPTRRDILKVLAHAELPAGQIASRYAMSRPAVSQHLKVLREAGLVTERRDGVRRLYQARTEGLKDLLDYLQHFWDDRLLDLKLVIEAEQKGMRNDD